MSRPQVVLVRGHQANSWHLRPWSHLANRFDVVLLQTKSNWFDTEAAGLAKVPVRTLRDYLPRGRLGDLAVRVPGDRYLGLRDALASADIVHSQDLVFWYSAQAAELKRELGYKLVLTVWETLPTLDAYRNIRTRKYRRPLLEQTDLFICTTERAKIALLLEGAPPERIAVSPPGVDLDLFQVREDGTRPEQHLIVSAGRLVWEKGHQDVLRALAVLGRRDVRALLIGSGPEEKRLKRYAAELGVAERVEFRREVPYAQMPSIYARASCLVLASLPTWFSDEQFGMVLVEAMSAGLSVVASTTGAIPEVLSGNGSLFAPGDWIGLARVLEEGPLAQPPGERVNHDQELLRHYSSAAAAERLGEAYDRVLAGQAVPWNVRQ
jgi:glycosyltransferase involved in cell wall biosynthesis